jgi:hypothetical protein
MKYFVDCEFLDTGSTIDLISIGIVCEDGRQFYVQNRECDLSKSSAWVEENVIPHLSKLHSWRDKHEIRNELFSFLDVRKYGKPELWGWCASYDFVALCQLYGTMMDLPNGWPHYIKDLQYLLDERGISDDMLPQQQQQAHHALADAKHIKWLWECLQDAQQYPCPVPIRL